VPGLATRRGAPELRASGSYPAARTAINGFSRPRPSASAPSRAFPTTRITRDVIAVGEPRRAVPAIGIRPRRHGLAWPDTTRRRTGDEPGRSARADDTRPSPLGPRRVERGV